jgi:hypothetical protein
VTPARRVTVEPQEHAPTNAHSGEPRVVDRRRHIAHAPISSYDATVAMPRVQASGYQRSQLRLKVHIEVS